MTRFLSRAVPIAVSAVAIFTGFAPRWLAFLGYLLALLLLFGNYYIDWAFLAFPFWVFLISIYILIDNLRRAGIISTRRAGRQSYCSLNTGSIERGMQLLEQLIDPSFAPKTFPIGAALLEAEIGLEE